MNSIADTFAVFMRSPGGWVFAGVWGALWGSFCNVAIHRIGLYESVVRPRSRCPSCGKGIAAHDNIPLVSWVLLGGRCRHCRARISWRYPAVEALLCGIALVAWWRFAAGGGGDPVWLLGRFFGYFFFAATLIVIAVIDLDHLIIPDRITYPAAPIFLAVGLAVGDLPASELLIGAFAGYGAVAVVVEVSYLLLKREGMGYGDAKLLVVVGALLGWRGVVVTFFGGACVGLVIVLPLMLARRQRLVGTEVPYGPFLVIAALAYLFAGHLLPWPLTFMARLP